MITFLLLLLLALWVCWPSLMEWRNRRQMQDVGWEKVRYRREILAQAPQSAAAHEQLADALRDVEELQEAIAHYERAIELEQMGGIGSGYVGGSGAEHKLKLTRLELSEKLEPEKHGRTLRTRQQNCPVCGHLNNPGEVACVNCGGALPVDEFFDTLRSEPMRKLITSEVTQTLAMAGVVALALYFAGWLSLEVKLVTFFAACIVLSMRMLKRIGPD